MLSLDEIGRQGKEASIDLTKASSDEKNHALKLIAEQLLIDKETILGENEKDIKQAEENQISTAVIDRIRLTSDRVEAISNALHDLIKMDDPIGKVLEEWTLDNGIKINKISVPIGVIGIIYEARPNVTVDAAALCLKSGNAVLLRGSSSAIHSNKAIVRSIRTALEKSNVPVNSIQLLEDTSRKTAEEMRSEERRVGKNVKNELTGQTDQQKQKAGEAEKHQA